MSIEYLSGMLFKPLNRSGLRLGLSLIIALSVITSPMVMLLDPTLVEASSSQKSTDPTSFSVPSTIVRNGGGGSEFTTQAPLSSVTARPTNNIVTTTSFYDIVFVTTTAGAIKTIEVTFPAGTQMPATPLLNEVEGIGPGSASRSGQTIIYTVANAVNVPAGTRIRLEIANINNPVNPSASYTVSVTTKNAANDPIDGPTPSTAYAMKQLGASIIAPGSITPTKPAESFMKRVTLLDGNNGWNPDGFDATFTIDEPAVGSSDNVYVGINIILGGNAVCNVTDTNIGTFFTIECIAAPPNGSQLHYVVENLPAHLNPPQ